MYDNYVNEELYLNQDLGESVKFLIAEHLKANMHTSIPANIQKFNAEKQRATVQITIRRRKRIDTGERIIFEDENRPLIVDVPVQFPQGGGFSLTFPVKKGDECLLVFCERNISNWKDLGGIQPILQTSFFDVGDCVALLGVCSSPKAITGFNTTDVELRNIDGTQKVMLLEDGGVTIKSPTKITLDAPEVSVLGDTTVAKTFTVTETSTFVGDISVGNISYLGHTHTGNAGNPTSPPLP